MQPINYQLAAYSDLFMLIAAIVYAAAFIAFALDMASSSKTIRALESELTEQQERTDAARSSAARHKQLVGAAGGAASTPTPGHGPGTTASPAAGNAVGGLVDEDMDYTGATRRPAANVAVALMVIAAALHAFAVIARALAAREGEIVQLVTGLPDLAHVAHERHLCVDTTAAGGNATLLAG